ncbi:alpha/beta fold hydrolase [Promicromonospora soli]
MWHLLGFGDSRLAPDAEPSIARQARTLAELAEHWGLDTPSLVGHDIGGGIVTRAHLVEAAAYLAPWAGHAGQQRWIDQVGAVSFEDTREVMARLGEITAPTLVLWGDQDRWLDLTTADRLAAAIPGAVRETVPGAGHFAAEDNPRAVAEALLRFLA